MGLKDHRLRLASGDFDLGAAVPAGPPTVPDHDPANKDFAELFDSTPLRAARAAINERLDEGNGRIIVHGAPGAGKTLLLRLLERDRARRGERVRRLDHGNLFTPSTAGAFDLLLIDEADRLDEAMLATTEGAAIVLACLRPPACDAVGAADLVELKGLDADEARIFVADRVSRTAAPSSLAPEAIDLLVAAGRGAPGRLRLLAGQAQFQASMDGAPRVESVHAEGAVQQRRALDGNRSFAGVMSAVPTATTGWDPAPVPSVGPPMFDPPAQTSSRSRWWIGGPAAFAALIASVAFMLPRADDVGAESQGSIASSGAPPPDTVRAAAGRRADPRPEPTVQRQPTPAVPPLAGPAEPSTAVAVTRRPLPAKTGDSDHASRAAVLPKREVGEPTSRPVMRTVPRIASDTAAPRAESRPTVLAEGTADFAVNAPEAYDNQRATDTAADAAVAEAAAAREDARLAREAATAARDAMRTLRDNF